MKDPSSLTTVEKIGDTTPLPSFHWAYTFLPAAGISPSSLEPKAGSFSIQANPASVCLDLGVLSVDASIASSKLFPPFVMILLSSLSSGFLGVVIATFRIS